MRIIKGAAGRIRVITAYVLICTLCLLMFCSCGDTKVVLTTGFGKGEVFVIGDEACTLPEVMVYLTNIQNSYESVYGSEIWNASLDGVSLEDNVKDTVLARIAQVKTMYLMAKNRGIELTAGEEGLIQSAAERYYSSLNETEKELLGIDKDTLAKMYREYALADKVYESVIKDINPEISDDEARFVKVQYIFFRTSVHDGAGKRITFSDSEKANVAGKVADVRQFATTGAYSFEDLAAKYSDSEEYERTFGKGEVSYELEQAAFSLSTGEISEPVETSEGFYLLKCISTLDREQTDANKIAIVEKRQQEAFETQYNEFVGTLVRNLNDQLWDEVSLLHDERVNTSDFFDVYNETFGSING